MSIFKKLLILFIILVSSFILYKLYLQRIALLKLETFVEGNTGTNDENSAVKAEFEMIKNKYPALPSIGNFNCPPTLQLKDVLVKSSYNTAFTGNYYVSNDMIKFVISRGCRFLDFEIYNVDGQPFIGVSSSYQTLDSLNKLSLVSVLNTIDSCAFSIDNSDMTTPNPNDPLILHFRIMNTNSNGFYKNINTTLESVLMQKMYNGVVNGNTNMSEIMGKYVVLIDNMSRGYIQDNGSQIITYKNGESNTSIIRLNRNAGLLEQCKRPPILIDETMTNVQDYQIVLSDTGYGFFTGPINPNNSILVKDYGVQLTAYKFYVYDNNMSIYENSFGNFNSAISLLSQNVIYFNQDNTE